MIGKECTFGASALVGTVKLNYQEVLKICGNEDYISVQDRHSSIGGQCVLKIWQAQGTIDQPEVDEVECKLQCEKCSGYKAFGYTDESIIGCGSCIGDYACNFFSGETFCPNGTQVTRMQC